MSAMKPESYRDDYDLEPGVHPALIHALHYMRTCHIAELGHQKLTMPAPTPAPVPQRWPFPLAPIPPDGKAPPRHPDAEPAPW